MQPTKIIVVDKDDIPIGFKLREELDPSIDIYRITAIWITNSNGEILIAQRKLNKKTNPGKWGPAVAGTVEEGETYESNAYKELQEEIGIDGILLQEDVKIFRDGDRKYFSQWYKAVVDKPLEYFSKQEEEVEQIKWISPADLERDIVKNPEQYIPSMSMIVEMFR